VQRVPPLDGEIDHGHVDHADDGEHGPAGRRGGIVYRGLQRHEPYVQNSRISSEVRRAFQTHTFPSRLAPERARP